MRIKHHNLGMAALPSTIIYLLILFVLSACGSGQNTATQTPTNSLADVELPESDWGTVELIAQAEQIDAPVYIDTGSNTIFTWTGAQDERARHFARSIQGNTEVLDLPAFFPQRELLFPINRGALKLWLDRNNSEPYLRLHMATISYDGEVLEGIIPISDQITRNFAAVPLDQHHFRVIWSGGLGEVTNLYMHHVDDSGRQAGGELLRIDADYPALIRDNENNIHLFWLSNNGRDVYHARFDEIGDPSLIDVKQIASNNLSVTDAITDFSVGFDGTYAYLLWTIRHIDDTQQIMMSSGQLTDDSFSTPQPLLTNTGETIEWIRPAQDTQNPLPMVTSNNDDLMLLWMEYGEVQETEFIATTGHLIGLPYIETTEDSIGVTWSKPTLDGYANLFHVSRPRNP